MGTSLVQIIQSGKIDMFPGISIWSLIVSPDISASLMPFFISFVSLSCAHTKTSNIQTTYLCLAHSFQRRVD